MVHEARAASRTLGNFLGPFRGTSGRHASGLRARLVSPMVSTHPYRCICFIDTARAMCPDVYNLRVASQGFPRESDRAYALWHQLLFAIRREKPAASPNRAREIGSY